MGVGGGTSDAQRSIFGGGGAERKIAVTRNGLPNATDHDSMRIRSMNLSINPSINKTINQTQTDWGQNPEPIKSNEKQNKNSNKNQTQTRNQMRTKTQKIINNPKQETQQTTDQEPKRKRKLINNRSRFFALGVTDLVIRRYTVDQNLNALNVFDKTSFHERMGVHIVRTDSAAQDRCKFEAQTRKGRNQRQAHGMPLHH